MRRFWRFLLRKSLAADSLAATRYAVFGLGDSGYVKFNVRGGRGHGVGG
jgi:sulfite reductase alpha subunit-like flavoprotein